MIIQLNGKQADDYKSYLQSYRTNIGKEPASAERTEAFFCAMSNDPWKRPWWIA